MDRKDSHIKICLEDPVDFYSAKTGGFENLRFEYDALPELSKTKVNLHTKVFGKDLKAPLFIGSMTGGTDKAHLINQRLAEAAALCGVGMALGSQRKMLDNPESKKSFMVKSYSPNIPLLLGNLGAVQLNYGVTVEDILRLIDKVQCDGFIFHLNPLQEAIQPEGQTDFSGLMAKLKEIIPLLKIPVIIKEVGAGISAKTAQKLCALPIQGLETAGQGGTSWAKIESLRASNQVQKVTGELFSRWGIPTPESIKACHQARGSRKDIFLLASGGMRNGIEVAKCLALGADAVGMALPFLKAAEISVEAVIEAIETVKEELRTVMFLTGSSNIESLRAQKLTNARDATAVW